jgi:tetratricopeptide (TPR) repeat protein
MMRTFIFSLMLLGVMVTAPAQQSSVYTHPGVLFEQGKDLYHQGKYAASYRRFEELLKQASGSLTAGQLHDAHYFIIANAFELRQKNTGILIENFLKKHSYTPFADELKYMQGMMQYEAGDYAAALQLFDDVKPKRFGKRYRNSYEFAQGYSYIKTEQFARASEVFRKLKAEESSYRIPSIYYHAYSEYYLKNFEAALPEFQQVEQVEQYRKDVTYYLFQLYYQSGATDSLHAKADYLLKNYPDHPNNAEVYRIKGELAYNDGKYIEAIDFLKRYESLTPRMLRHSSYLMGMALMRTGRHSAAVPYLQLVTTDADVLTENAYLHLGHCFVKLNDKVNARMAFEAVLRTKFDARVREEAMLNYALTTYETTSAFGESIYAMEQFLNEYPNSKGANSVKSYLASAYMASRNYDVAYESINKIKNPNDKILEARQFILFQLGSEAFAQNRYEQAIEYFNLSVKENRTALYTAESYYWRSESYYRLGKLTNSISDLRSFLANQDARSSKNYVMAHYSMGYAHFRNQNFREARRFFETFMNLERNKTSDIYADAMSRIGDCMFYERDFSNAEMMYSRAANLSRNTGDYSLFQSAYVAGLQKKYSTKISRLNSLVDTYPQSAYIDDALYEIGRAYIMINNEAEAMRSYRQLISLQPNSAITRKAALEIGMIYLNQNKLTEAIVAYKEVVSNFPGSVEAFTALESLENIYIEINDVPSYIQYANSLNRSISGLSANRQDSISYIAAEKQYMNGNYTQAVTGLRSYLQSYCSGGRYCTSAQYYLADSYYRMRDSEKAIEEFRKLMNIPGNQYMEEANMRTAELLYDKKDFRNALIYFRQFEQLAQSSERKNMARLGILRSAYQIRDYTLTVSGADAVITDARSTPEMKAEARYLRAKSYVLSGRSNLAMDDLKQVAADTRTEQGAEAKYLLADLYFEQKSYALADKEVQDFARVGTPYQYWLARSFIVLADVHIAQKNDFQAKQYLLSLQRNYKTQDDIQGMIDDRLSAISKRERAKVSN